MKTSSKKKLKTGSGAAETRNVTKPRTATVGHTLKNAKYVNRAAKKIRTEAKRRDESRTVETASYMAEGANAAYSAGEALSKAPGAVSDAAKRLKKIPYKLASDYRRYKIGAVLTIRKAASAPARIKNAVKAGAGITRGGVAVAALHTAVVGSKALKTTAVVGMRGITKTAVISGKGLSAVGSVFSNSDNETVRTAGTAMKTAETGAKAAKTTVQVGQKAAKTAIATVRGIAARRTVFSINIRASTKAVTHIKNAAREVVRLAVGAAKLVGNAIVHKFALPIIIVILAAVAMTSAAAPISAAVIQVNRLFPFEGFAEFIDGLMVWKDSPAETTIKMYMADEASIANADNATIALLEAGANEKDYAMAGAIINPAMRDEYIENNNLFRVNLEYYEASLQYHNGTYFYINPETKAGEIRSIDDPPTFDKTPYFIPPTEKNEAGQYVTDGSAPNVGPKYMGMRWSEKTDHEGYIPSGEGAALQKEMLAALVVNKMKLENEGGFYEDWTREEVKNFYNSLPLWTMSVQAVCEYCNGCESYTYTEEYETTHSNPDGSTSTSTNTRTVTAEFCPGHIWDEVNIQTDEDPDSTITGDAFNIERVLTKLNFTEEERKQYQDTLDQINWELLF